MPDQIEGSRTIRIRVLDDAEDLRADWVNKIQNALKGVPVSADVQGIPWKAPKQELEVLETRRKAFHAVQKGQSSSYEDKDASVFDDVDVLFIDYKLFSDTSEPEEPRLTGLELAYLVRAYSSCKVIVSLNSQGGFMRAQRNFDLTLREASERIENLHLTSADIGDSGLWLMPDTGYRPWLWPLLCEEVDRYEARLALAGKLLDEKDKSLVSLLGFTGENQFSIPAYAIDHLGRDGIGTTPNDFLWLSGHVVRGHDFGDIPHENVDPKAAQERLYNARKATPCVRLLAAAVHRWLERMVLVAQDVLIDRPHLLMRWPGLEPNANNDVSASTRWGWAGLSRCFTTTVSDIENKLSACAFADHQWLSRPAYWWAKLQADEEFASAVAQQNRKLKSTIVFQEDTSRFATSEQSSRFRCGVPSANPVRFCAGPPTYDKVSYEPISRLAS